MRAPWSRVAQGNPKLPHRQRPATWEGRNIAFGLQAFLAESQHAGQRTGGMFDRARFEIVEGYPHDATRLRFRDMAGRRNKPGMDPGDPDYAAGVLMAACRQRQFWIVNVQRLRGFAVYPVERVQAKEIRALPFASAAQAGNVFLVAGPWNRDF